MPLYEVLCISAHTARYADIHTLVKGSASLVLTNNGVVRSIRSWGTRTLPMKLLGKGKSKLKIGDYWTMQFDASPRVVKDLAQQLREDNMVLRWTVTKLGERLGDITKQPERTVIGAQPHDLAGEQGKS